ncbi:hypothetical protein OG976_10190 [Mycobacterium sp. NBC_00419]|uniref:hypothetical protein n=1 Tax=Mycobacterium sp. NBC_00419 TaxID=2975989 RepID=UPI002E1B41F5
MTTLVELSGAVLKRVTTDCRSAVGSVTAVTVTGVRRVWPVAGRLPTTVRALTVVEVVRADWALPEPAAAVLAAPLGDVAIPVWADRADRPVDAVPDFAGASEAELEPWSGPSAQAMPRDWGPASDKPTTNAAAPNRALTRGVDIAVPAFPRIRADRYLRWR